METIESQDNRTVDIDTVILKAFIKKRKEFKTKRAASDFFGISRVTLDAIEARGTCKPNILPVIIEKLSLTA